ncbi:MAG: site-2 protease family protein [Chlamydiota bacterium]
MIYSLLYLILAALGLGVLVFIHELGHYFMARKEGMKVEAFSIGFGKPMKAWEKDGVKWQICWVPFGGYVRISGMEKKGNLEPYQIEDGFYGKKPWARIKVALAGPVVNIVFSFLVFCLIWTLGGREKPFSDYTKFIGWVDVHSDLHKIGVNPGDEIACYGGQPFQGFSQLLSSAFLDSGVQKISGYEIDYIQDKKTPFSYTFEFGRDLKGLEKYATIASVINPAAYLIYKPDVLMLSPPIKDSGIIPGDRILWVDGELVFSKRQLTDLINEPKSLLTVQRGAERFFTKIPRLQIRDLRMNKEEKAELQDWAHAGEFKGDYSQLYFIPYAVTNRGIVEYATAYVDKDAKERKQFEKDFSSLEIPLLPGDVILSVDGKEISSGGDLLTSLQNRSVQMIVQRGVQYPAISWKKSDSEFTQGISFSDLDRLSHSILTKKRLTSIGDLYFLQPVEPKPLSDLPLKGSIQTRMQDTLSQQKKQIEGIKNPKEKALALKNLEQDQGRLFLGAIFEDRKVLYNPSPFVLFKGVFEETGKTFRALFTGYLSPKYMSGPIGIVGAMQYGWALGIREALFWIAVISVNLGLVNLLPIPVLDGGHICFALYEAITKKRIKAKTMEKFIFPFVVLIIIFFIYLTYQDVLRLISRFF